MEEYVFKNNRKLKRGYTTGTCAAAAAKAAAILLLGNESHETVRIQVPRGAVLNLAVLNLSHVDQGAKCCIRKDSGDDPDVTDKAEIYATVTKSLTDGIHIDGGKGVGRVTKPGLPCEIGEAAINPVPRKMIEDAVKEISDTYHYDGGLDILIEVPKGEELAKRTYNGRLGIIGGISILGTGGIVEPMSEHALVDSIKTELRMLKAIGYRTLLVSPGNYSTYFAKNSLRVDVENSIKCSNFVGDALDYAAQLGFEKILMLGHVGKFVKLAGGIMNTHSRYADCRMELLGMHAALQGADQSLLRKIMHATTTDDALEYLIRADLKDAVMQTLTEKILEHLTVRVREKIKIEIIVFSNRYGILSVSDGAYEFLKQIQAEDKT